MKTRGDWIAQGSLLIKEYEFKDFANAISFINNVATLSESHKHHPDIMLYNYKHVRIMLTTHLEKAVTNKDLTLAAAIDKINMKE